MDTAQWMHQRADSFQEFGVSSKVGVSETTGGAQSACTGPPVMERKVRPQKDQALNCPRCHSTNTKFCYYNNYSLTQPRYFCKTCRRYWTQGGTLRNVPVGGGSRKNKKSTCISPSLTMAAPPIPSHRLPDLNPPSNISQFSSQNPKTHDQGQDLNLGFQLPQDYHHHQHGIPHFFEFPKIENRDVISSSSSANSTSSSAPLSALNFLSNGIAARGLNSFIPMAANAGAAALFAQSGFPFQECNKPTLGFSMDGNQRENCDRMPQENSLMFSFGAAKRNSSGTNEGDQGNKGQENSNGFWNGMSDGGSNW